MKTILPLFFFLFSISILKAQNPEWITYIASTSGLPDNDVITITIDGSGNKWIGTQNNGLAKFDGTTWTVYNTLNSGLPDNYVCSIAIDGSGNKWIGTKGGLAKFDGKTWTVYTSSNSGLPYTYVSAIAIDGSGNKWIGTWYGTLTKFDGTNWTVYSNSNSGMLCCTVYTISIDGSGNKWIGAMSGLAKFDGTTWTIYDGSNTGMYSNVISSIAFDGSGNKWIGSDYGLDKFDGTSWTFYHIYNSGLPANRVSSVAIDSSGNKWIGINYGLAKFDGSTWKSYTASNSGLPSNYVTSIVIDGSGNKWIGMHGGLAVFKEGGIAIPAAKVQNGQFDNGTQDWQLSTYATGAAATFKVDANSVISGTNSCAVTISQTTGTDWHIQMWQGLNIYPGHKYTITFKAKASANRSIILALQKAVAPNTTYLYKSHNLTTQVQTFTDEVTINTTDQAKLQFYFGSSTASVWIDDITIVDTPLTTGIDDPVAANGNISVLQNYPNPFASATTIKYKVTEPGFVSMKVFNAIGNEITTLLSEKKPAGDYSIEWNAAGLKNGIYYYKMQNGSYAEVRKMLLIK